MNQQQKTPTIQECRASLCTDLWRIVQFYAQPDKLNLTADIKNAYYRRKTKKHMRAFIRHNSDMQRLMKKKGLNKTLTKGAAIIYKICETKANASKAKAKKYRARITAAPWLDKGYKY